MKVVISGYGRMGRMIEGILQQKGIENVPSEDIQSIDHQLAAGSVCIDFTTPDAFKANYRFLAEHFKAAVVGTTGWYDIQDEVLDCFKKNGCTMIYASNFSIGVNIFFKISALLSRMASSFEGYAPSITEVHHIHKLDKPSGTAKTLAQIVEENSGIMPEITSIREGEVAGVHELEFTSTVDKINIRHEAFSREGFARGAVEAAIMADEMEGVFEFRELMEEKFSSIIKKLL